MKYREARLLKPGDWITRKRDDLRLQISSIELFGQYKKIKVICVLPHSAGGSLYCSGTTYVTLYNEEF